MNKAGLLLGRVLLAHIFVLAGINKIIGYAGTQQYMESQGVAGWLLPAVILLELGGGLAVVLGWQTRLVALAIAIFTVLTAVIFHGDLPADMTAFMKNLSMAGGFIVLAVAGAGAWSLDGYFAQPKAAKRIYSEDQ